MDKILVSACLLGENCKYSGGSNYNEDVVHFLKKQADKLQAVFICPEVLGGLPIPRDPAEICGDFVMTRSGKDVTEAFEKGAGYTAEMAKESGCRFALLKERSPSCGCGRIYDGTFTGTLTEGDGKTAARLKRMGIGVYGETELLMLLKVL